MPLKLQKGDLIRHQMFHDRVALMVSSSVAIIRGACGYFPPGTFITGWEPLSVVELASMLAEPLEFPVPVVATPNPFGGGFVAQARFGVARRTDLWDAYPFLAMTKEGETPEEALAAFAPLMAESPVYVRFFQVPRILRFDSSRESMQIAASAALVDWHDNRNLNQAKGLKANIFGSARLV